MENERMESMQNLEPVDVEPTKRKPFWKNTRGIALFVAFVLIFSCIGGYTLAYLSLKANSDVENQLKLATVSCSIVIDEREESSENTKIIGFKVKNEGNAYTYVRVAMVANWKNLEGDVLGSAVPVRGDGLEFPGDYYFEYSTNIDTYRVTDEGNIELVGKATADNTDWFMLEENGVVYYYYRKPVASNDGDKSYRDITSPLFDLSEMFHKNTPVAGYFCTVDFALQGIQAAGGYKVNDVFKPAVELAWDHVKVDGDGYLTPNS